MLRLTKNLFQKILNDRTTVVCGNLWLADVNVVRKRQIKCCKVILQVIEGTLQLVKEALQRRNASLQRRNVRLHPVEDVLQLIEDALQHRNVWL
jgi:hypothetical protein